VKDIKGDGLDGRWFCSASLSTAGTLNASYPSGVWMRGHRLHYSMRLRHDVLHLPAFSLCGAFLLCAARHFSP